MNKLDAQIMKTQKRLADLKRKKREQEARQRAKLKPKSNKKRGRPRVDEKLLIRAIELAETMPLADAALRVDLPLSTLYNYGISRRALTPQDDLKTKDKAKSKK